MTIRISGTIFACKVGEDSTNRYTIVTTQERNFHYLTGTACIIESGQDELLKAYLQSDTGINLAKALGVDDQRVSRMRAALEVGYQDGGNRRSMEYQQAPDITGRLKVVGHETKKVIIASSSLDTWQLVPTTQILLQPTVKGHLKRWIQQTNVDDISSALQIGKRQVTELKRLLGELRKQNVR